MSISACSQGLTPGLAGITGSLAGVSGLPGSNAGQTVNAGPLVQQLNQTMLNMSIAQQHTFDAFGLKNEAEKAASNAKAYENGNALNADVLEKTSAADAAISTYLETHKTLSTESKKKMALAMPYFAKSMVQSAGLGLQMSQAASSISSNPMSLLAGAYSPKDLLTVFVSSPKLLTQMATTTRNLTTFASTNKVDTADVDASLKDLK